MGTGYISLHRQLVYFLSQFDEFRVDDGHEGKPLFMMRKKYVSENFKEEFSPAQMKGAAEVLANLFNLVGTVSLASRLDLPKLLQAYFLDEEKRKEINKLL
jgi:hypothetical protein